MPHIKVGVTRLQRCQTVWHGWQANCLTRVRQFACHPFQTVWHLCNLVTVGKVPIMCFLLYCTLNCLRNCACRLACKLACVCKTVHVTYKFAMTKRIPRTLLQRKALKCKPLANCACVVPLIDVQYAFTRGLHAFSLRRRASYSSSMRVRCDFLCLHDTQSKQTRSR